MLLMRSMLFNGLFYVFLGLCSIIAMTLGLVAPRRLPGFARWWSSAWLAAYRTICGVAYEVRGFERLPGGGCLIAMKHQSAWDTFAMFAIFPQPVFIFKSELARIPAFGTALLRLGCVPVERGTGKAALESMIKGAATACAHGKQVVIFPEGTRTDVGASPDYKTGVSHLYRALGVPCVLVALNSGLLWPRRGFLRPSGTIKLEVLSVLPPGLHRKDMQLRMAEDIEAASLRLCGQ